MKKIFVFLIGSSLFLSSCNTYTGSGAYAGASLGSILGSAIGGITGGYRGSDIGTVIGMAGGAVVGAAVGSQADQARNHSNIPTRESRRRNQVPTVQNSQAYDPTPSDIFDSNNSGDDRLYNFQSEDYTGNYSAQQPVASLPSATVEELGARLSYSPSLEIVNARFVDTNQNNVLNRNETAKLIFEVMNYGTQPVFDVVPTVVETTGNKHIFISPGIHIEKIEPGQGVRYTAMVKADNKLKDGMVRFCVSVIHGYKSISKVNEFNIPTKR